ncbi:MFS transporter [Leucobacter luti]|uniref:CP family cyanate transporter-like MFS transporter n=1 Tax=Leucobacter luti TaxID=340320 RepID=A0A4Q7U488_9MICO|nr:MFS transporter [Leucobacter luti]MBL3700630.1 MFS transporter [Leucobacter luti]RZT68531.1 CP family cyanate transporter-like MFS transporter [Leucobacter luti]
MPRWFSARALPLFGALLLVALNLRLGVTSASALLTALTESGALTPASAVLVPAIPTAVFALAGVGTARLAARLGAERMVLFGMLTLTLGLAVRAIPQPWVVIVGTILATGGLAVVNILLPAVVRAHFGQRIGPVTTAYSTVMSLGAATAAAAAVPLATAVGSPTLGLALWALPALLATLVWAVVAPRAPRVPGRRVAPARAETSSAGTEAAGTGAARTDPATRVRRPLPAGTGLLAAYFALQALLSYVAMGWLPSIAIDAGISAPRAGMLLGITMAVGVPATVIVVPLARSIVGMRVGFVLVAVASVAALSGLLLAPAALPELWAALVGVGMCAFPLVLALIAGFGADAGESARVSGVVQSLGYSLATLGPLGAGALRQLTGGWDAVLLALVVAVIAQGTIGVLLTRVIKRRGR